ncbi:MAG: ribonuclease III [Ruminococcaceae bacterium]|nr:ribonuclease III [Oscillospiraceae bacterium]
MSVLEEALGYTFKNKALLQEALTHSSYSNEVKAKKQICRCNERLEFMGDAVLSAVVSEYLFEKFPNMPEGELSTMRAALVQSQALASYSRSLGVGDFLYLGHGEEKNDGRNRQSTLENVFEAIIAAIYLDAQEQGFFEVRKLVLPIIKAQLADSNFALNHTDAKTELQQLIQQTEGDFLEYRIASESGPDHNKTFTVFAMLNSNVIGTGEGHSKREAEQAAAREALKLFGKL